MSAPVGNINGKTTWFPPIDPKEKTVRVQGRILESRHKLLREVMTERGLSESEAIREAMDSWLSFQAKVKKEKSMTYCQHYNQEI